MKLLLSTLFTFFFLLINGQEHSLQIADKPLFRDSIYDGAADPVIIYNKQEKLWYMFYTNRRAKEEGLNGVSWVHGTKIGIATSKNGASWNYKTTCNINYKVPKITHWAPDVIENNGTYHMYLTIVPGVFMDWKHPRYIIHLTSANMVDWAYQSTLNLVSDKCIDAAVFKLPSGIWRMYYNNERDSKSMYYADSKDLYHWVDSGKKVISHRGEGAKVFSWKNKNWMLIDSWDGLSVFNTTDFENWTKQENNILKEPGTGIDDKVIGGHPDVVVQGDKAYVFYFTHPGRTSKNEGVDSYETRRSCIQVAELEYKNGIISCDRNKAVSIRLQSINK